MSRLNVHLWGISAISEVNSFLSRKAWIPINRSKLKAKGRNPVPVKWVFKSKGYPYSLILLKSINLVKGYMQVTVVDYTESFSLVSTDTSTIIMIGITFFQEEKV